MRAPEIRLWDEIIVDSFAGGGGASEGIWMALGRGPDIAINHDAEAIAVHAANHPETKHFCESIYDVVPKKACAGRKVGLAWFSPDCKHFSKAKGAVPVDKNIRGLAWQVVRWAKDVRPRVIVLENVEEFQGWGPLLKAGKNKGKPDPARKGQTFVQWLGRLKGQGYEVEWRQLKACDYGAPTTRKRLFVIARRDGQPIVWPATTHGPGRPAPYRTAAECISWEKSCPSIFERGSPLAENTLLRIARGIMRYVVDNPRPFIVPVTHAGDSRTHSIDDPLPTITGAHRGEKALVAPVIARIGQANGNGKYVNDVREPLTTITSKAEHLLIAGTMIQRGWGERHGKWGEQAPRCLDIQAPLGSVVAGGIKQAVVAAYLAKHCAGTHPAIGQPVVEPLATITGKDTKALVATHLTKFYGTSTGASVEDPMPTVTANGRGGGHIAEVRAFLVQYYGESKEAALFSPLGTVTTKDRFGLVEVEGEPYAISDIGMRMLEARELYRAQGFRENYVIEPMIEKTNKAGKTRLVPLSKTAQVRCVGNSVCPPLAAAIVRANYEGSAVRENVPVAAVG